MRILAVAGIAEARFHPYPRPAESHMLAALRIQTILAALVVLNLIGLTIAAYRIMRRK